MYRKLAAEGLFKDEYKKPLPPWPRRIGILTSESGAAAEDIRASIHSRWPCVKLFLYPVPVQGEGASEQIAAGLRDMNRRNKKLKLDIVIVSRGGGSLEDLWAFNEEVLARAIFDSAIPVISAVGHEIDTTIADLVADATASTPTKAGVTAVPDMKDVLDRLASMENRLGAELRAALRLANQHLQTVLASEVFRKPLSTVRNREQLLDETEIKLRNCLRNLLARVGEKLHVYYEQVHKIEPHQLLKNKAVGLYNLQSRCSLAMRDVIGNRQIQLTAAANRLGALNPKSVLQRGYSITTNKKTGLIVKRPKDIRVGDYLITELSDENLIESKVTKK
jgi:exodeoxyribonuclease VII large subunit